MEKAIGNLRLEDGRVTLRTKPYEIKTIKVQFASLEPKAEMPKP